MQPNAHPSRRRGRVPLGLALVLAVVAGLTLAHVLRGAPPARALVTVDPRCSSLAIDAEADWVDPRWADELAWRLAVLPAFRADEPEGLRAVRDEVLALAFVAEVHEPRVVWPDGVELDVRLRRPAACVRVGESFLAVAEDGVVLPGVHTTPPWVGHGWLPVLGPNDRTFDDVRPGDALWEERHLDALSVAISMRAWLSPEVFEALGPPLIDATRARAADVHEPGVRIDVEGARRVGFGRAPWTDEPGELPARLKWASLERVVLAAAERGVDWAWLDLRWDEPEVGWRAPDPGAASPGEG